MKKPFKVFFLFGASFCMLASMTLVKADASPPREVTVTALELNVHSANSFNSKDVKIVHKGNIFTIYSQSNGMYNIGKNEWITANSKYVRVSSVSSKVVTSSSVSSAQSLIKFAEKYMGLPYVWGSADPSNGGFDCSGFIYYVFKHNGYNLNRLTVAGFWNIAKHLSQPEVGDLVFFKNTYTTGPSHMGIYVGNNKFINANDSGIEISDLGYSYWKDHFLGYGRF